MNGDSIFDCIIGTNDIVRIKSDTIDANWWCYRLLLLVGYMLLLLL